MPMSKNQLDVVLKVVEASGRLEKTQLVPEGELTIRWRIEMAAAFLAGLIDHAKVAARDDKAKPSPKMLVDTMVNIAIKQAQEIDRQGHG